MVFPVIGGDGKPTGYDIDNSFRFDDASSSFLQRTNGANTGEDNATLSFWFKLGNIKTANNGGTIFCEGNTSGDHVIQLYAQKIYIGSENFNLMYPNLIRDPSAWYHLFVAFDSTQGTAANRVKPYLNGVLLENPTGFTTYPDQNENLNITKNGTTTRIGGRGNSGDESFDGYLAEFHYLDGTTKAYTDFGEFNDNGVWIPKKYIGGSYGDNGFFLEFKQTGGSADASGLGADTSGEGHHFSGDNVTAAEDITIDTPTNNFATMNPLDNYYAGATLSEGNNRVATSASPTTFITSTQGVARGKWYWEVIIIDKQDGTSIGVQGGVSPGASDQMGYNTAGVQIRQTGQRHTNGGNADYMAAQSNNDIVMVAFDRDNNNVYFGANGQWGDGSGNTDEANPSSAIGITVSAGDFVFPALGDMDGSNVVIYKINFGNPCFSISSGNADANGYGNFEYAPPSGYYSLCTKNLAQYG